MSSDKGNTAQEKRSGNGRRGRPQAVKRRGFGWGARLLALLFLSLLLLAGYLHHLNTIVKEKFEGRRWTVPAHVYARPLELFPGALVHQVQLLSELKELGYREVVGAEKPGTYQALKSSVRLHSRGFQFWDGAESAQWAEIGFNGSSVEAIRGRDGASLSLLRLEPVQIASIYPVHTEDRVVIGFDEMPDTLVKGLVAVEDGEFFQHFGISFKGIFRAMMANIKARRMVQGGSTLTQQLVKNFYLTQERSLRRKLNEALMALLLELQYDKKNIFQAYANEIYLGQDGKRAIHGFALASRFYFNRPLQELDVGGQALLIALIRGASFYNPVRNPERAKKRRDLILDIMVEHKIISRQEADSAKAKPLNLSIAQLKGGARYPAFMDLVRRQLARDYRSEDLNSEGLRIFSTIDPWVQRQAEEAIAEQLKELEKLKHQPEGTFESSVVAVGRDDGEIHALVGGRQADFAGFNRALDAVRPIGSLVKPPIYLTALKMPELYSLVSPLRDEPLTLQTPGAADWEPKNYDHQVHGVVPLYEALAKSYNLATVQLGLEVGVPSVADTLKALGVTRDFQVYPSLLLGAIQLSPIEVAQVYQTLAGGGYRTPLRSIREVLDQSGKPLQRYPLEVRQVVDPGAVHLVNTAMQTVVQSGTASSLARWVPADLAVAGKTGTTDELRDSWFAGFTGDRVVVAWVGRDDNKPTGLSGASGALQVWGRTMKGVSSAKLQLTPPDSIAYAAINPTSGKVAGEGCPSVEVPFIEGYLPPLEDCTYRVPSGGFGSSFWELFR